MKKEYEPPIVQILVADSEDVIRTSGFKLFTDIEEEGEFGNSDSVNWKW